MAAVEKENAGASPGGSSAPPVATVATANVSGNVPAPLPAQKSVAQFGGNATGRESKFKFRAGTPEGDKERRDDAAALKKARRHAAAKLLEPPPLPSAGPGVADQVAPPTGDPGTVLGAPLNPAGDAIPWDPGALQPLFDELIDAAETGRVEKLRALAKEGQLPDKLVKEIAEAGRYSPMIKRSLSVTAPKATAKVLNRVGISGKYSDEGILMTALLANFVQGRRTIARLERLIEENKPKAPVHGPAKTP